MDAETFLSTYESKMTADEITELKSKEYKKVYFAGNIIERTNLDFKMLVA